MKITPSFSSSIFFTYPIASIQWYISCHDANIGFNWSLICISSTYELSSLENPKIQTRHLVQEKFSVTSNSRIKDAMLLILNSWHALMHHCIMLNVKTKHIFINSSCGSTAMLCYAECQERTHTLKNSRWGSSVLLDHANVRAKHKFQQS